MWQVGMLPRSTCLQSIILAEAWAQCSRVSKNLHWTLFLTLWHSEIPCGQHTQQILHYELVISFQSNPGHPSFHMVAIPDSLEPANSACNLVKATSTSLLDTAEVRVEHCGSTVGSLSGNISQVQQQNIVYFYSFTSRELTHWLHRHKSCSMARNHSELKLCIYWKSDNSVVIHEKCALCWEKTVEWSLSPTSHWIVGDI